MLKLHKYTILVLAFSFVYSTAYAADMGHYSPDSNGVRDYVMSPDKGFTLSAYNMYYTSNNFRGRAGVSLIHCLLPLQLPIISISTINRYP